MWTSKGAISTLQPNPPKCLQFVAYKVINPPSKLDCNLEISTIFKDIT